MFYPNDFIEYGIQVHSSASGDIKTTCPQCSQQRRNKGDQCLSVNIEKGCWNCHHCGWSGGIKSANPMAPVMRSLSEQAKKKEYVNPDKPKTDGIQQNALDFLSSRGITKAHGLESVRNSLILPYYKDGKLVNIKYRDVTSKRFSQSKGGMPVLWRYDECMKHDRIIICEGEMDALALMEAGFDNATSIPAGADKNATELPEHSSKFDFLVNSKELVDNAKEVVVWMDDDEAGRAMQKELVRRIGKKKCLYINDSYGHKDANDVLLYEGPQMLKDAVNGAKYYPIDSVITYADAVADIVNFDPTKKAGISTGFTTLDEHFRLSPGDLCVMVGIPESGKSEFCDQLVINSMVGSAWQWAYYTPENMPIERHFVRVAEKYQRKPYTQIKDMEKAETIVTLSKYINIINDDEVTLDKLFDRLETLIWRKGINAFILDPWNELEHKRPSAMSETEYIGMALQKCRQFARNHDILFIIVAHPTKMNKMANGEYPIPSPYDINGSANWRNKADSCISVWRSFNKPTNEVEIHITKMRNKYAGKNGKVYFQFNLENGTYTESPRYDDNEVSESVNDNWLEA